VVCDCSPHLWDAHEVIGCMPNIVETVLCCGGRHATMRSIKKRGSCSRCYLTPTSASDECVIRLSIRHVNPLRRPRVLASSVGFITPFIRSWSCNPTASFIVSSLRYLQRLFHNGCTAETVPEARPRPASIWRRQDTQPPERARKSAGSSATWREARSPPRMLQLTVRHEVLRQIR
jgi:hypothetical protein